MAKRKQWQRTGEMLEMKSNWWAFIKSVSVHFYHFRRFAVQWVEIGAANSHLRQPCTTDMIIFIHFDKLNNQTESESLTKNSSGRGVMHLRMNKRNVHHCCSFVFSVFIAKVHVNLGARALDIEHGIYTDRKAAQKRATKKVQSEIDKHRKLPLLVGSSRN